ncbi:hypothetical protein [Tenacibaculum amylolyticum]|uniref:hypothetical protein n=1 Tax=Tenacibaculum amylolyticum TaxID=104269 RepID=UPI0038B51008
MNKMIIVLLVIVSCNAKKKEGKSVGLVKVDTVITTAIKSPTLKKVNVGNSLLSDVEKAINFLKKKNVIDKKYNFSEALDYKIFNNKDYDINLLKLNYEKELGANFLEDPVVNILYVKNESKLLGYHVFYSIEEEDFNFSFKKSKIYFFEYYDSSTGWKNSIYYDNGFHQTHKYDETDKLDINSINLNDRSYKLIGNDKVFKFKKLQSMEK